MIYIINKALKTVLQKVVGDGYKSVAICGLGIDEGNLDPKTVARITAEICNKYDSNIEIKIIDDDENFIKEINNLIER